MKRCLVCDKKSDKYIVVSNGVVCNSCVHTISNIYSAMSQINGLQIDGCYEADIDTGVSKEFFLYPQDIRKQLDEYVIGQDNAKKILSVAAYNHYKRTAMKDESIQKSNVLLIGPTGSGKTYLVRTLAKILDVPLAICSATDLTEAGYVGKDVDSVIKRLLAQANGDVKKAEHGIVFIDEVDKLVTSSFSKKEVGGVGVQQALLPLLEGTEIEIENPKEEKIALHDSSAQKVTVDTSNILFICGGAFPDAENIINKRMVGDHKSIGFSTEFSLIEEETDVLGDDILSSITTEDLKEFGMISEFLGRVPIIATVHKLDVDALMEVLYKPKGSLVEQYTKLFDFDNIVLQFNEDALREIAVKAYEIGTGARSLRAIMESLLLELMYTLPGTDANYVTITKEYVIEPKQFFPKVGNTYIKKNEKTERNEYI